MKIASLQPGTLVAIEGSVYRIASRVANADGVSVKFASKQGKYVSPDENLRLTAAYIKQADEVHVEHHGETTNEDLTHEDEGQYIRMVYLQDGDLELQATENLKQAFAADESWMPTIYELLDDFMINGWGWVNPEDVKSDTLSDPDGHVYHCDGDHIDDLRTQGKFVMDAEGKLDSNVVKREEPNYYEESFDLDNEDELISSLVGED